MGLPECQRTANVWARAILQDDYGVRPEDITWVRGGIDTPGRPEKIPLQLPPGVKVEAAPQGCTISELLDRGALGEDDWSYGVDKARKTLETFVRHHHAQGLSKRLMAVEELFHPATYESYSI